MMIGQRNPSVFEAPMDPMRLDVPQVSLPAAAPHQGHKLNWGAIIADALSGLAGQQGQYPQRVARERAEQTEFERGEQRYQRQRADRLADDERNFEQQQRLIDYRATQAPDDQFSRYMDMANIPPEQRAALYGEKVRSMANPPRYMTGPNGEIIQIGGQAPAAPSAPVGKLRPLGGPMPSASGGFRQYR